MLPLEYIFSLTEIYTIQMDKANNIRKVKIYKAINFLTLFLTEINNNTKYNGLCSTKRTSFRNGFCTMGIRSLMWKSWPIYIMEIDWKNFEQRSTNDELIVKSALQIEYKFCTDIFRKLFQSISIEIDSSSS